MAGIRNEEKVKYVVCPMAIGAMRGKKSTGDKGAVGMGEFAVCVHVCSGRHL